MPSQTLESIRSYVKILNKLKVSCLNKHCKKVTVVLCAKLLKTNQDKNAILWQDFGEKQLTQDTTWKSDKTSENITHKRIKRLALSQQVTTRLQCTDKKA